MKKRSILVADDESLTRERICSLLTAYPDFEVIAETATGTETLQAIKVHKPDIVFLDIKMPQLSGMEVLRHLGKNDYSILVFISAHKEYALEAFENEALDYLLKPFDQSRFRKLMLRLDAYFTREEGQTYPHLLVRDRQNLVKLKIEDIIYLRSDNNHVRIVTEKGEFRKRISLGATHKLLGKRFIRIHRSYIINEDKVRKIKHISNGDYLFTMTDQKSIASSKSYRMVVRNFRK